MADPTHTDPDKYRVVFENERVRVLEYRDEPGARTSPHDHPDSVMVTLSAFRRRLVRGEANATSSSMRVRFAGWRHRPMRERTSARHPHTSCSSS
jgi:beta-alanine degradation protein BauB